MAGEGSVGAPIGAPPETTGSFVDESMARGDTMVGHGNDALRNRPKRKAKDAPATDLTTPKVRKLVGRPLKNPYQVFSNLLPRHKKPKQPKQPNALAKMPKIPPVIICDGCGRNRPASKFDCDNPCDRPHVPTYCLECTQIHIIDALNRGDVVGLSCPTCGFGWAASYLRRFFIAGYQDRQYQELAKTHPHYRPCLSPECDHGQIHIAALPWQPKVRCEACGAESCFTHKIPWHKGFTCAQWFDAEMERAEGVPKDDSAGAKEAVKSNKRCRDCTLPLDVIEETTAVLRCKDCKKTWCSDCLVDQEYVQQEGAHKHAPNCRYWAPPPWDEDGDVRAGLERLRQSRVAGQRTFSIALPVSSFAGSSSGPATNPQATSSGGHSIVHSAHIPAYTMPWLHPTSVQPAQTTGHHTTSVHATQTTGHYPTTVHAAQATGHEPLGDIPTDGDMPIDSNIEAELAGDHNDPF